MNNLSNNLLNNSANTHYALNPNAPADSIPPVAFAADESAGTLTGAESVFWNLADLYPTFNDGAFAADMELSEKNAKAFYEKWYGKIVACSASEMKSMILELQNLYEVQGRLGSRVSLNFTTDQNDPQVAHAYQSTMEKLTEIRKHLVFATIEIRNMSDEHFAGIIASGELQEFKHWLEFNRAFKPHTLTEAEEILDAEKDLVGIDAWTRFYDQQQALARFDLDGKSVSQQEIFRTLSGHDREKRKAASEAFSRGLERDVPVNGYVFNTMLADKQINDRLRGFSTWVSSRNKSNKISDAAVESLVQAVVSRYDLSHRFFALKRQMLGLPDFFEWDRNAPATSATNTMTWEEARQTVCSAYHDFDPRIGAIVDEFFEKNWIDAGVRPGKRSGAFSSPAVPSVHPYILMNYTGTHRDVKTLAHELGHGVHQYLARVQGYFNSGTPLTVAETASVFGEMLVFDSLMKATTSDEERLTLLMEKLNDMVNTVFRQVAMNRFEDAIHNARRSEGELSMDRLNELWMQTQTPSFGDSVTLTDSYKSWWSYIPHMIHTPGYVYAYAFGELLVLALYQMYTAGDESFRQKYYELLQAGGRDTPDNLLQPFGIDLADPAFWMRGLDVIDSMVSQAEAIAAKRTA